MAKKFLFQPIQLSQSVPIQTIQFSISTQFSSIKLIDGALSDTTIPGQSGPGSDGNEGVLHVPQSFSITRTSPSECLGSYPGYLLGVGGGLIPLQRRGHSILNPHPADLAKPNTSVKQ